MGMGAYSSCQVACSSQDRQDIQPQTGLSGRNYTETQEHANFTQKERPLSCFPKWITQSTTWFLDSTVQQHPHIPTSESGSCEVFAGADEDKKKYNLINFWRQENCAGAALNWCMCCLSFIRLSSGGRMVRALNKDRNLNNIVRKGGATSLRCWLRF